MLMSGSEGTVHELGSLNAACGFRSLARLGIFGVQGLASHIRSLKEHGFDSWRIRRGCNQSVWNSRLSHQLCRLRVAKQTIAPKPLPLNCGSACCRSCSRLSPLGRFRKHCPPGRAGRGSQEFWGFGWPNIETESLQTPNLQP